MIFRFYFYENINLDQIQYSNNDDLIANEMRNGVASLATFNVDSIFEKPCISPNDSSI